MIKAIRTFPLLVAVALYQGPAAIGRAYDPGIESQALYSYAGTRSRRSSNRPPDRVPTLRASVSLLSDSSHQLSRVHRFLWRHWQQKARARVHVELYGKDAGMHYTVEIRPERDGQWGVVQFARHYQVPESAPEPIYAAAEGRGLRPHRNRNGSFEVRLVTQRGTVLPLFQR
jgi:hypothetical protein